MSFNQHEALMCVLVIDVVCAVVGLLVIVLLGFIEYPQERDTHEQIEFPDVDVPQPRKGD